MDTKERRHCSLTRGRCRKDFHHAMASREPEECRVATQKSYSSSETLKAYDPDTRMRYGGCVAELVHHEHEEYVRQGELYVPVSVSVSTDQGFISVHSLPFSQDFILVRSAAS
ncbi:teneurin-2-like [Oncorhynchus mykiss]|uniref:teneurin-2-like n=1 Tax=Oncorhynchus mykiss TaxID=8022 RepID=UPI001878859B|nr:teneurin-2-like [Oncorhynchus mykiss]